MSKLVKKGRGNLKKMLPKVDHSSPLQTYIPAGLANAKPPLGSQLGQVIKLLFLYDKLVLYIYI